MTQDPVLKLPQRPADSHKGTFGTVAVVGGCAIAASRMIGAPVLSARAALRAGAGIARLAMPAPILDEGIGLLPSATGVSIPVDLDGRIEPHDASAIIDQMVGSCQCLVVGPGLGHPSHSGPGTAAAALRAVQQEEIPVVIDADALNALAQVPHLSADFHAAAVLTPHPGEFRTLAASLSIRADPVDPRARPAAAEALAQRLGCIVVLKGSASIVTDGHRTWTCGRGHPCLATAGTGDVLAGTIASLVAQNFRLSNPRPAIDLFSLACIAVDAHAAAGELWAKTNHAAAGLLAPELADLLPQSLEPYRAASTPNAAG